MPQKEKPRVGVIMGSESDWEHMQHCSATLDELGIAHECRVLSAHRVADRLAAYCKRARRRGILVIIAGAGGGAAHLPGMTEAQADEIPVVGVPMDERSITSVLAMPKGAPVGTMNNGEKGAVNAALYAAKILAINDREILRSLRNYRRRMRRAVEAQDRRVSRKKSAGKHAE